jgi:type I restriction-modification system DNA methylase subunit
MDFQSRYEKLKVIAFLGNFLPEDFVQREEEMTLPFKAEYLSRVTLLGRVSSLDNLRVYEIEHGSENDPRVSLSREAFRLMLKFGVTRALIFFVSERSENYRFSLITLEIKPAGKGLEKKYSNPRRYSFYLGPKAKSLTPTKFLIQKGRVKDFSDLQNRFSIEVVNKEFYAEIAKLFTELAGGERMIGSRDVSEVGSLHLPSVAEKAPARKEFAVRLIGRLVFCWFLKKKASNASRPLIPEEILGSAAVDKNAGYYHSILEPLFFETLNTPVDDRQGGFRKHPWSEIPFLNGGLFDAHPDDFYEIGTTCHSKHINTLKVPDDWLRELLKVFEVYNFTIDENTSVDIELSIDPEMLGRVFENLLAEINPETGETARKSSGSYYTPRVIVDYLVDECLKQFLQARAGMSEKQCASLLSFADDEPDLDETHRGRVIEALGGIRIIDPACGSGAFPMGILQKMLQVLRKVDRDSTRWRQKVLGGVKDSLLRKKLKTENLDYIFKLGIIRDSIYGVDIQPIAMEISKLRFFLSLIVDEKIDDKQDNRGIQALPNLEFKFVCADSLIPLEKPENEDLLLDIHSEDKESIHRLKELRDDYFTSHGKEKRDLESQFRETQDKMKDFYIKHAHKPRRNLRNEEIVTKTPAPSSLTQRLALWDPFGNTPAPWFDPEWMFGMRDGFDIVIANPPYVRIQTLNKANPDSVRFYKEHYESAAKGNYDLYVIFVERGLQLLASHGHLGFILPHKFFNSEYGIGLRKLISDGSHLRHVVHFGDHQIFPGATNYVCLVFLEKDVRELCRWVRVDDLSKWLETFTGAERQLSNSQISATEWNFPVGDTIGPFEKLQRMSVKLGGVADIFVGLQTSADDVFILNVVAENTHTITLESASLQKNWIFEKQLLSPLLSGTDIRPYAPLPKRQFILFPYEISDGKAELIHMERLTRDFPKTADYLRKNKKRLEEREGNKLQGTNKWHGYIYLKNMARQSLTKLCIPRLVEKLGATCDVEGTHFLDNVDVGGITLRPEYSLYSLVYVLALLNSTLLRWYFSEVSAPFRGGFRSANKQFLALIPFREIDFNDSQDQARHDAIVKFANRILTIKQSDLKNDTNFLEREIDQRVYQLYGLTPAEIKIVEEAADR